MNPADLPRPNPTDPRTDPSLAAAYNAVRDVLLALDWRLRHVEANPPIPGPSGPPGPQGPPGEPGADGGGMTVETGDERFVNVTGDVMTGNLDVGTASGSRVRMSASMGRVLGREADFTVYLVARSDEQGGVFIMNTDMWVPVATIDAQSNPSEPWWEADRGILNLRAGVVRHRADLVPVPRVTVSEAEPSGVPEQDGDLWFRVTP